MSARFRAAAFIGAAIVLAPQHSRAAECDARAADLVRLMSATLDRRTSVKVILRLPPLSPLDVDCMPATGLTIGWSGAFPPATFYEFVGRAGQIVTDAPAKRIKDGAARCQKAALRADDELADLDFNGLRFECQAFTRDGGGTLISIYRPPH